MDEDKEAQMCNLAGELGRVAANLVNLVGHELAFEIVQYAKDKIAADAAKGIFGEIVDPKDN